jgi:hypothetical protein
MLVEPACGAALATTYDRSLIGNLPAGEQMLEGPIVVVCCGGSMATPSLLQEWMKQMEIVPAAKL